MKDQARIELPPGVTMTIHDEPDEPGSRAVDYGKQGPTCGCCKLPLGDAETAEVSLDDGSDFEIWHLHYAEVNAEECP